MAVNERASALSRCRSDDAERASKARLSEHTEVRVRAGARETRQGQSSRHDVGETIASSANGFGYFPRKESNPRRWTARKKTWMSNSKVTGSRLSPGWRQEW